MAAGDTLSGSTNVSIYRPNRFEDIGDTRPPTQSPGVFDFGSRLHTDQYPDQGLTQNFAAMLLGIALRILHPDMTRREEMMMYGQKPAPGVSEENLRSPNVSPLAIRRVG